MRAGMCGGVRVDRSAMLEDLPVAAGELNVQDSYHLPDGTMRDYDADVTFFTIVGTEQAPRWFIHLRYIGTGHYKTAKGRGTLEWIGRLNNIGGLCKKDYRNRKHLYTNR